MCVSSWMPSLISIDRNFENTLNQLAFNDLKGHGLLGFYEYIFTPILSKKRATGSRLQPAWQWYVNYCMAIC